MKKHEKAIKMTFCDVPSLMGLQRDVMIRKLLGLHVKYSNFQTIVEYFFMTISRYMAGDTEIILVKRS